MSNPTVIPIENLKIWSGGNWVKHTVKSMLFLRIHCDQLLITSEDKVLESFNIKKNLKVIYKDDILILITNADGQQVRKIKFQIRENLSLCLQKLKARFSVVSYGTVAKKSKTEIKYKNIEDVFKNVLDGKVKPNESMPENYTSFLKLCLLDPMFPQLVEQTAQIIDEEILKKN